MAGRALTKAQRFGPSRPSAGSWLDLIRAVRTPLGFFVLVVLVVEAIIGGVAGFSSATDQTFVVSIMAALD